MARMRLEFDVETNGWGFIDREIVEEMLNEVDNGRRCYAVEKLMETLDHILRCEPNVVVSIDPRFTLCICDESQDDGNEEEEGFRLRPEDEVDGSANIQG